MASGELATWLSYLRLDKYAASLTALGHDTVSLASLDDAGLAALGLPLGPRKKILMNAGLMLRSATRSHESSSPPAAGVTAQNACSPAWAPGQPHFAHDAQTAVPAPSAHGSTTTPAAPASTGGAAVALPGSGGGAIQGWRSWRTAGSGTAGCGGQQPVPPPDQEHDQNHLPHQHRATHAHQQRQQQSLPAPQAAAQRPAAAVVAPRPDPQSSRTLPPPAAPQPARDRPVCVNPWQQQQQLLSRSAADRAPPAVAASQLPAAADGACMLTGAHATATASQQQHPHPQHPLQPRWRPAMAPGPAATAPPPCASGAAPTPAAHGHASGTHAWAAAASAITQGHFAPSAPGSGGAGVSAAKRGPAAATERRALAQLYPQQAGPRMRGCDNGIHASASGGGKGPHSTSGALAGSGSSGAAHRTAAAAWGLAAWRARGGALKRCRSWDGSTTWQAGEPCSGNGDIPTHGSALGAAAPAQRHRASSVATGGSLYAAAASAAPVDCSFDAVRAAAAVVAAAQDAPQGSGLLATACAALLPSGAVPTGGAAPGPAAVMQSAAAPPGSLLQDARNYETPELLAQLLYDEAGATASGAAPGGAGGGQSAAAAAPRDVSATAATATVGAPGAEGVTREQRLARLRALREEVAATERLLGTLRRMVADEEAALAAPSVPAASAAASIQAARNGSAAAVAIGSAPPAGPTARGSRAGGDAARAVEAAQLASNVGRGGGAAVWLHAVEAAGQAEADVVVVDDDQQEDAWGVQGQGEWDGQGVDEPATQLWDSGLTLAERLAMLD